MQFNRFLAEPWPGRLQPRVGRHRILFTVLPFQAGSGRCAEPWPEMGYAASIEYDPAAAQAGRSTPTRRAGGCHRPNLRSPGRARSPSDNGRRTW